MITEKIYDRDSHINTFKATVLDCQKIGESYGIVLDKTAFSPRAADSLPTRDSSEMHIYSTFR